MCSSERAPQAVSFHRQPWEREEEKCNYQVTKAGFLWESEEPSDPVYHIAVGIQPHPHPLPAIGSLISTNLD